MPQYSCSYCARPYAKTEHLKRHERSRANPVVSPSVKQELNVQDRNERPYQCLYCLKRFARSDTLLRHSRTLHAPYYKNGNSHSPSVTTPQTHREDTGPPGCDSDQTLQHSMRIMPELTSLRSLSPSQLQLWKGQVANRPLSEDGFDRSTTETDNEPCEGQGNAFSPGRATTIESFETSGNEALAFSSNTSESLEDDFLLDDSFLLADSKQLEFLPDLLPGSPTKPGEIDIHESLRMPKRTRHSSLAAKRALSIDSVPPTTINQLYEGWGHPPSASSLISNYYSEEDSSDRCLLRELAALRRARQEAENKYWAIMAALAMRTRVAGRVHQISFEQLLATCSPKF